MKKQTKITLTSGLINDVYVWRITSPFEMNVVLDHPPINNNDDLLLFHCFIDTPNGRFKNKIWITYEMFKDNPKVAFELMYEETRNKYEKQTL